MDITLSEAEIDELRFEDALQATSVGLLISGAMLLTPLRKSPTCCWIGVIAFCGVLCRAVEGGIYLVRGLHKFLKE